MGLSKSKYIRLLFDTLIFILGTVLAKMIQFFLMPLYTTYMTTNMYGSAELINNLSELFLPIVTLCIYDAVFRFAVDKRYNNTIIVKIGAKILFFSLLIGT